MRNNKFGFTLVEVIVVMLILATLSTLGLVFYGNSVSDTRDSFRKNDLSNIENSMDNYYNLNGEYPEITGGTNISSLTGRNEIELGDGVFQYLDLNKLPVDPDTSEKYELMYSDDGLWYKIDKKLESGETFSVGNYPKSCKEIYVKNNNSGNGTYTIFENGVAREENCIMDY